jgi:hypothetical protein
VTIGKSKFHADFESTEKVKKNSYKKFISGKVKELKITAHSAQNAVLNTLMIFFMKKKFLVILALSANSKVKRAENGSKN